MTGIDWAALSRLVPEAALVVIFGLFALALDRRQDESNKRREEAAAAERRQRDEAATAQEAKRDTALSKREQEWREFLREERQQHATALGQVVTELRSLGTLSAATNALVSQHDIWERAEYGRRSQAGD